MIRIVTDTRVAGTSAAAGTECRTSVAGLMRTAAELDSWIAQAKRVESHPQVWIEVDGARLDAADIAEIEMAETAAAKREAAKAILARLQ